MMHVTCPTCSEAFPITAGFMEADGKRFAMLLAGMEPALGRAVIDYLSLFTPAKQKLRLTKAIKTVASLDAMVREGTVCRDERAGVRRPSTAAHWVAGIEQMMESRAKLVLPLANHAYLRSVVYSIADRADAAAEKAREDNIRAGRPAEAPAPSANTAAIQARMDRAEKLGRIQSDLDLGLITEDEAIARRRAL